MDDGWTFLLVLALVALLIDGIPPRKAKWSEADASQRDTELIVAGRQREEPRHLLTLILLLIVAFVVGVALINKPPG